MSAPTSKQTFDDRLYFAMGSGSGSGSDSGSEFGSGSGSSSGGNEPPLPPPSGCSDECGCSLGNDFLGDCGCPIDLGTGAAEVKLNLLPTQFGSFQLAYSNLWQREGVPTDMEQGVGRNWATNGLAYSGLNDDGNRGFVWSPGRKGKSLWFSPDGFGNYAPLYGTHSTLEESGGQYVIKNRDGSVAKFDIDSGQLVEEVTPGGDVTQYTYAGDKLDKIQHTVGTSVETRDFAYTGDRVTSVTLYKGTTTTPLQTQVRRIVLGYYGAAEDHGQEGDLKTVTEQAYVSSAWEDLGTTYFRYYTQDYGNGFDGGLKYVVGPEEYAGLANPDTDDVSSVAKVYYEYDIPSRRATASHTHGGEQHYTITDYDESSLDKSDPNNWSLKTVLSAPDGSSKTIYANSAGMDLLIDLVKSGDRWITFDEYNSDWRVAKRHSPSAVASYSVNGLTDEMSVTVNSSSGLIRETTYYTSTGSGAVAGYPEYQQVRKGSSGTPVKLSKTTYEQHTEGGITVTLPKTQTVYRDDAGTDEIVTTFNYEAWHAGTNQPSEIHLLLPELDTGENEGAWNADRTRKQYFDVHGRMTKSIDARGTETTYAYDDATGAVTQVTQDAGVGGEQLVTNYEVDALGRTVKELGPEHDVDGDAVRTVRWTEYLDDAHEARAAQGYYDVAGNEYTLVNPISITKTDESGRVTDQIEAVSGSTVEIADTELADIGALAQSTWSRWTQHTYDGTGRMTRTRVYHDIPTPSGAGSVNTNYHQTDFSYDGSGRRHKVKSPGGTITKQTYDPRGLALDTYVGTDDTGTSSDNMRLVSRNEYDDGNDGGDGKVTKVTRPVNSTSGDDRVTRYEYDWRNRQTATVQVESAAREFRTELVLDNLGRAKETLQKRVDINGSSPPVLFGHSKAFYDKRGRVFKTERIEIDNEENPGNSLVDNTWFDEEGNVLKSLPAGAQLFTKNVFDSLGRNTISYRGFYAAGTEAPQSVATDWIMEEIHREYDEASQVIFTTTKQRWHEAAGLGALQGPSGSHPKSRDSYLANWYDGVGHPIQMANYGTNAESVPTRDDNPADVSGNYPEALLTKSTYNKRGELEDQSDPAGKVTRTTFDDAGRVTSTVRNHGGSPTEEVQQTYTPDGQVAKLIAINATTGNQETEYTYGTTLSGSEIARNDLLFKVEYPDNGEVSYAYNRQGQRIEMTDQNETVHSYSYDRLGRQTADTVALASGSAVDDAVLRIERTFDDRMRLEKVTSYDAASGGNVVNEVQYAYNFFNQVVTEYQEHDDGVDTGSSPKVQYEYAPGSANTIRPTKVTYPNGSELDYVYGIVPNDRLSRISALKFDSTTVVGYDFLGLSTPVTVNYPEPAVRYDLATGSDSNPYAGLDRFGRIVDLQWIRELSGSSSGSGAGSGSSEPLVHLLYGYDQASNRKWREDAVAADNSKNHDEYYTFDGLHRLTNAQRGNLTGSPYNGVTAKNFEQKWTLDSTGNWSEFDEDEDGTGWSQEQARNHNAVNEITSIGLQSMGAGTDWADPAHDANGNMTTFPSPSAPSASLTATYDAWNRLVKLADTGGTFAEYEYDGLNRRITKTVSSTMRHYYFSDQWQVLEERVGSATSADRQYVWGERYVDDLVLRDRTSERLYALQDALFNVVALTDATGSVKERFAYQPYGQSKELNPDYTNYSGTNYTWEYRFTGRELDLESGLQLNRRRYLHLELGRWLTRDPIGYEGGMNLYNYVHCRPTVKVDPFGLGQTVIGSVQIWDDDLIWDDLVADFNFKLSVSCKNGKIVFDGPFESGGSGDLDHIGKPTISTLPANCANGEGLWITVTGVAREGDYPAAAVIGGLATTGAAIGVCCGGGPGATLGGGIGACGGVVIWPIGEALDTEVDAVWQFTVKVCCDKNGQSQFSDATLNWSSPSGNVCNQWDYYYNCTVCNLPSQPAFTKPRPPLFQEKECPLPE